MVLLASAQFFQFLLTWQIKIRLRSLSLWNKSWGLLPYCKLFMFCEAVLFLTLSAKISIIHKTNTLCDLPCRGGLEVEHVDREVFTLLRWFESHLGHFRKYNSCKFDTFHGERSAASHAHMRPVRCIGSKKWNGKL